MSEHKPGDVRYSIDHDKRVLFAKRYDDLTKEGIYGEWHAMQQVDGFNPAYDTIVDYSLVPRVDLDVDDLMELNREMPHHDPRTGNIAIVAGARRGRYLLGRFFCTLTNMAGNRSYQVFHTMAEAEAWITYQRENKK